VHYRLQEIGTPDLPMVLARFVARLKRAGLPRPGAGR
jgi:hypothetical protein